MPGRYDVRVYAPPANIGGRALAGGSSGRQVLSVVAERLELLAPTDVSVRESFDASIEVFPARDGRRLEILAEGPGGPVVVGTGKEDALGVATIPVSLDTLGPTRLRARTLRPGGSVGTLSGWVDLTVRSRAIAPSNFVAVTGGRSVDLQWSQGSAAHLTGYELQQARTVAGPWAKIATLAPTKASHRVGELVNGRTYYFRIRTLAGADLPSFYSTVVTATPNRIEERDAGGLRSGVAALEGADVVSAQPAENGIDFFVEVPVAKATTIGQFVVIRPGPYLPVGLVGETTARHDRGAESTLRLAPASLIDVFNAPNLQYDGQSVPAPMTLPPSNGGRSTARWVEASAIKPQRPLRLSDFECTADVVDKFDADLGLARTPEFHVTNEVAGDLSRWTFGVDADVEATITAEVRGATECKVKAASFYDTRFLHHQLPIRIAGLPVVVEVYPDPRLAVSSRGTATFSTVRTLGADIVKTDAGVSLDFKNELKSQDVQVGSSFDGTLSLGLGFALVVGGGRGQMNLKAGFDVTALLEVPVKVSHGCAQWGVDLGVRVDTDTRIWNKRWQKTIAYKTWPVYPPSRRCSGPPEIKTDVPRAVGGTWYQTQLQTKDIREGTWSLVSGALPEGLSLSPSGVISGHVTRAATTRTVTVGIRDPWGNSATAGIEIPVDQLGGQVDDVLGSIVRVGTSAWYLDKRGGLHVIRDGGTFDCIAAQGKRVNNISADLKKRFQVFEDAQCVRANRGDVVRDPNGASYLIDSSWAARHILDGQTYLCLAANQHPKRDVPKYWVLDLAPGADFRWDCVDAVGARGHVIKVDDYSSWYIDLAGNRHHIPTGGTFECLVAQGKTVFGSRIPRESITRFGHPSEPAACVRAAPGDIVRDPFGNAHLINGDWTRSRIPDGGSFLCLAANGHHVVNAPSYYIDDLTENPAQATMSCYDANAVKGKVVRASNGRSYYVDERGTLHHIPNGGTFECIAEQRGAYQHVVPAEWLTQPEREAADCVRAAPGSIIKHPTDGDAYLINQDWTRSWIPDGGSYLCLWANGHHAVNAPRYYIEDLTENPAHATMSCYDANAVNGKVVRASDGSSWYVDKRAGRHHIPDGGTYDCIAAQRGAYQHVVPVQWLNQTKYEDAECVRANPGDIIRHPVNGDAYVINADWTRSWIPTGGSYNCFRAAGKLVVGAPRYYIEDLSSSGSNAVYGNCIIRRPDGASWFVNNEGSREWIPDSPTWDCEVGRGVPVLDVSDGFVGGIGEVGWHYCLNKANLRGKVLRHVDGDAYFIHGDDTKTWIPDEFTFNCRTRAGSPVVTTRWREYVDAFPGAEWDWCFDVNTFKGRFIRHPAGDAHWVGADGVRHWVPDGGVYNCLKARYGDPATVRWREYINAIPEGGWASCP